MTAAASLVQQSPVEPDALEHAPNRRKMLVRSAIALLAVGLAAAGILRYRSGATEPLVRYETAVVDEGPLDAKVTATGAVSPLISVQVGSQVSGRISALLVDFGSSVRRGQTVATVEPSLFQAAVAQGRANRAAAHAGLERAQAQKLQADRQLSRG